MDYQNAQQYSNQTPVQKSELNPLLLRTFLDREAQNIFSYVPNHQISQMFPYPSYDAGLIENALEGYTWPAQVSELDHTATDTGEPPQVQTGAQLQSAVPGHTADGLGLRQVGPSFEDRFNLLEDRIGGLEVVIQDLRNELQEKMRFFADMEAYIKKLVAWTKESKDAVDSLVADLKQAVALVASK